MKRLVLLLLTTTLLLQSCKAGEKNKKTPAGEPGQQQQTPDTPKQNTRRFNNSPPVVNINIKSNKDSVRVIVDSILYGTQELKVDTAGFKQMLADALKQAWKKDGWDWSEILQWLIFAVAAAAIIPAWMAYRAAQKTLDRDKKYKDLAFIAEVDKMLIEHPELWAYEDGRSDVSKPTVKINTPVTLNVINKEKMHFIADSKIKVTALDKDVFITIDTAKQPVIKAGNTSAVLNVSAAQNVEIENTAIIEITETGAVTLLTSEDHLLNDKIDAFCYYKLNNFELALKDHDDEDAKECWEKYLAYIYRKSTRFRKIITTILTDTGYQKIYNKKFVKQIRDTLVKESCIDTNGKPLP